MEARTIITPEAIKPIIVKVIKVISCKVGYKADKISYIYMKIHI